MPTGMSDSNISRAFYFPIKLLLETLHPMRVCDGEQNIYNGVYKQSCMESKPRL